MGLLFNCGVQAWNYSGPQAEQKQDLSFGFMDQQDIQVVWLFGWLVCCLRGWLALSGKKTHISCWFVMFTDLYMSTGLWNLTKCCCKLLTGSYWFQGAIFSKPCVKLNCAAALVYWSICKYPVLKLMRKLATRRYFDSSYKEVELSWRIPGSWN